MKKVLFTLRLCTSLYMVILLVFLAWNCLDMYLQGSDLPASDAMFTFSEVKDRLKHLAMPCTILIVLSFITSLFTPFQPITGHKHTLFYSHKATCVSSQLPAKSKKKMRWFILIAGGVLVLFGIANGSLYDVFVKSINICTECIGLG